MISEYKEVKKYKTTNDKGEVIFYSNAIMQQKLYAPYEDEADLQDVRDYHVKHNLSTILEKYIRYFDADSMRHSNINRTYGFYNKDNNCCFIIGDLCLAKYIDNLATFTDLYKDAQLALLDDVQNTEQNQDTDIHRMTCAVATIAMQYIDEIDYVLDRIKHHMSDETQNIEFENLILPREAEWALKANIQNTNTINNATEQNK